MAQLQVVVLARLIISITWVIQDSLAFTLPPITKAFSLRRRNICRWVMIRLKSIGKFIVKRLLPTFACAWVFFVIPPVSLQGQYVFEFHTGSALGTAGTALDGQAGSVNYTQNGITLTAEAFLNGSSSGTTLNGASTSFGVNDALDDEKTQRIDKENGGVGESIQFSFNLAGAFDEIDLQYIEESSNEGTLHFAGSGTTVQLNTGNTDHGGTNDNFDFSSPYSFSANEVITLGLHSSAGSTENYSLQSFTITPYATGGAKTMLWGDGSVGGTTAIGTGGSEVDVISPGLGFGTSISSASSQKQSTTGRSSSADAIGSLSVNTLNWNSGGVYDWEISDFDPSNNNGYDVLNITNLTFDNSNNYDINILPVNSSGGAGVMSNYANTGNNYTTTNGFLFLDAGSVTNSPGTGDVSSFFDIRADDFAYQVNSWYGDWGVHHDGSGNFYLTYSVVPEPSTYAMVFGLFGIIFLNPRSRTSLLGFLSRIRGQNQFRKQHIRNALPYS